MGDLVLGLEFFGHPQPAMNVHRLGPASSGHDHDRANVTILVLYGQRMRTGMYIRWVIWGLIFKLSTRAIFQQIFVATSHPVTLALRMTGQKGFCLLSQY